MLQTAKGTIELSDRLSVDLPDGRTIQESFSAPRFLRKGMAITLFRLPDNRFVIIGKEG